MKRTNAVRRWTVKHTLSATLLAGGLLAQTSAGAQTIELADVGNGTGGFRLINPTSARGSAMEVSSAGDVNGDGLADTLVWMGDQKPFLGDADPVCFVVFGQSGAADLELSSLEAGASPRGFYIHSTANLFQIQDAAAAGDVNGDGLGDLVFACPSGSTIDGSPAGRTFVVFGKASSTPVDLSQMFSGGSTLGFALVPATPGFEQVTAVAGAGDVNGDGLADLVVGVPQGQGTGSGFYQGKSYVVFGKTTAGDVALSDVLTGTSSLGFPVLGENADAQVGLEVSSAGDVNGDGLSDVLLGAPLYRPVIGFERRGRSYVVFGKTSPDVVRLSSVSAGGSGLGLAFFGEIGDYQGHKLSGAGDVNGDGFADVLVAAPGRFFDSPSPATKPGRGYVIFGGTSPGNIDLSALNAGSDPRGFVIEGNVIGSRAGFGASSAGDVNGDGLADVLVGAPKAIGGRGRTALVLGRTSTAPVAFSEMIAYPPSSNGLILNGDLVGEEAGSSVASAGDLDGDGRPDILIAGPRAETLGYLNGVVYAVLDPLPMAPVSTYRAQVAAGDPDRQAIGTHRYGDDETVYPDSRLWIDFDGGAGPGLAASSEVVATITRSKTGLGADPTQIADVQWAVSTNRTGYPAARVTVRYTNAEIAGLVEGHLRLLTAPTIAGPFTIAADATINTARNEAAGTVASLPAVFALGDVTGPVPTITRLLGDPTANQNPTWSVVFDEPVGAQFTTDDIAPAGSLAGAVSIESITGTSPNFTVKLVADGENLDGTLGFDIVGGAVADAFGTASVPAVAPAYTIAEIGAGVVPGDIDRDGQATVADVTALANHIVNGTPLP